ncbi:D-lactate dehydrogenase (cytochrome) [Bradyrhizobium ottawaense]
MLAVHGGVTISFAEMNEILEVRPRDLDATVQAGVTRKQLNHHLRDTGLFFPVDPGADASLGGMASTRASGTNSVRYGTMRDNVVRLTVVTANGRVIRTKSRARKSAAGYDLTGLFTGQEGTLGIITEVTVRLYGIPETIALATANFPDIGTASDAVIQIIQLGVPVARAELLDVRSIEAVNMNAGLGLPCAPTLFFEFHGTTGHVQEQLELVQEIVADNGGQGWRSSTDADERSKLWKARHESHQAFKAMRPNSVVWGTDVCVPIGSLAECIRETYEDIKNASFFIGIIGHVGDGNFHLAMVIDPERGEELAEAEAINGRLIARAIRFDGTCTGEHGIGLGKMKYMRAEHGDALDTMQDIKMALDPFNILNPGKVVKVTVAS